MLYNVYIIVQLVCTKGDMMDDFKYLNIVQWAKGYIKDNALREGSKFFSEKELCDIHKVSRQTVRQALLMLENDNIIQRKRGSGTFIKIPAKKNIPTNFTVGVISTYFSDYIFPSIVTGIEKVLKENNVIMQISITHNQVADETRALNAMLAQDINGLIIEPSKSALPNPNMMLYERIKQKNIPVVFFNAKYPWTDFPYVAMDDFAAGKIVTQHLWDIGHRRISGIFALDDIQGHMRYSGYMDTLLKHNSPVAEKNVIWYSTSERHSFFTLSEERILNLLSESTAIVCYNDNIAVSLLSFCKKHSIRVPEDISIVGIDNAKLSTICEVPLTTATHPHQILGERAAQKLLDAAADPGSYQKDEIFTPELIVRRSTMPYRR